MIVVEPAAGGRKTMRRVINGAVYQLDQECLRAECWFDPEQGDWLILADCASNALRYRVLPSGLLLRLVRRPGGWYDQVLFWRTTADLRRQC